MTLTWAERVVLYGVFTEPIFLCDWARPGVLFHLPIADLTVEEQIEAFLNLQAARLIVALDEKIPRQNKDDPPPGCFMYKMEEHKQLFGWYTSPLQGE